MAFEPHFANYYQLCVNIGLNGLQDRVTPLCLALADRKAIAAMNLASVDFGTSMSSFGEALDFRGRPYAPAFRQGMMGCDIDSLVRDFGVAIPNHVKIDVDGIELPIVRGATQMLAHPEVKSVSIELIETDAAQVEEVTELLARAGLRFLHKKQNSAFATPDTRDVLNFLYRRAEPATMVPVTGIPNASNDQAASAIDAIDVAGVVARLAARIAAAPIDPAPSENIYLEDIFPAEVYREMLDRLPADDVLDPIAHPDAVAADGRVTRSLLDLTDETLARFNAEDRAFWRAMKKVFTAPELTAAIVDKFKTTLRARFGDRIPELVAVPVFYRDFPGYRIGIHPDMAGKIATLQFYLPADDSQRHLGTSFHTRQGRLFHHHKTNIFAPNTAYGFVRTDESWHSVSELGPQEKARNTLALTFYIKGHEYRSDPRMGMMMDDAAPAPEPAAAAGDDNSYAGINRQLRAATAGFTRRDDIARLIPAGGVGVELGMAAGEFSERIFERSQIGYLFGVDSWAGDVDQYMAAVARLNAYRDRNTMLRMGFDEAINLFGDETVDFVYVGGAQDGQVLRDWYPKLRRGGVIAGAVDEPGAIEAVDAFIAANGLEPHVIKAEPTWFALKP